MTDGGLLSALRLADSFLLVGSYTISYGLESFVEEGYVEDGDDLRKLLIDYLRGQIGSCDMVALSAAHRAAREETLDHLVQVDDRLHATLLTREFRESSLTLGKRLLNVVNNAYEFVDRYNGLVGDRARGHYPTVLGVVTAAKSISEYNARLMCGYGFVTGSWVRPSASYDLVTAKSRISSTTYSQSLRALSANPSIGIWDSSGRVRR